MNTQVRFTQDNLIEYRCLCCNKNYQHKFDEKLKEQFFNKYKFSNYKNNEFILLLLKSVCPYEHMDDWEKFNENLVPKKEDFCSNLNMEDITDTDYAHGKKEFVNSLKQKTYEKFMICMFKAIHYC